KGERGYLVRGGRRAGHDAAVDGGKGRAVHDGIGHQPRVENVQEAGRSILIELHDPALEELNGEALEREGAAHRITKGCDTAPVTEVVPDHVVVDAKAGLRKIASGGLVGVSRWGASPDQRDDQDDRKTAASEPISGHSSILL